MTADLAPVTQHDADRILGRIFAIPVTARSVWFQITTATGYPGNLPIPTNVLLMPDNVPPLVSLTLPTAEEAETWARWADTSYCASWSADGSVWVTAERSGWKWHIHGDAPKTIPAHVDGWPVGGRDE